MVRALNKVPHHTARHDGGSPINYNTPTFGRGLILATEVFLYIWKEIDEVWVIPELDPDAEVLAVKLSEP